MSLHDLPPELLARVLMHFSLPELKLLKAVSRATANACRRMLRSTEWSQNVNEFDMAEEVSTQCNYKLPMVVSIYEGYFEHGFQLLATVYKLKIKTIKESQDYIDSADRTQWDCDHVDANSNDIVIVEMCIEIHGKGIFGSVWTLRRMIQEHMRKHASQAIWRGETADQMLTYNWKADKDGDFYYDLTMDVDKQTRVSDILYNICPVTEISKGVWEVNKTPCPDHYGYKHDYMNVIEMCQMGLDLFV
jgi:hypothetical protein